MFKLDNRGFTLIELIVVIAILGMLAGLTIPNVIKIQDKARIQVDRSNIAILKSAANMAIVDEGLPELEVIWNSKSFKAESSGTPGKSFNPQDYLDDWPKKPSKKDSDYQLTINTEGKIKVDSLVENNESGQ